MDGALEYALKLSNSGFMNPLKSAIGGIGKLGAKVATVAAPLAAATAAAGALTFAIQSMDKAGQMEQFEVGIANILGTKSAAISLRGELEKFSTTTPFTFMEDIAPTSRMLLNAGVSAADMRAELNALGNVASGAGKDLLQVAEIYAKALNKNVVNAEVLDSFRIALVPIDQMLADVMGRGKDEISKLASEGQITGDILRLAFQKLGGATGDWGEMMAQQSLTNKGLISTMKDNVDALMVSFGQPINDAINPLIQGAISKVQDLKPAIASIGESVGIGISRLYTAATTGNFGAFIEAELKMAGANFINYIGGLMPKTVSGLGVVGDFLGNTFRGAGKILEQSLMNAASSFVQIFGTGIGRPMELALKGIDTINRGKTDFAGDFNRKIGALSDPGFGDQADKAGSEGEGFIKSALAGLQRGLNGEDIISQGKLFDLDKQRSDKRNELDLLGQRAREDVLNAPKDEAPRLQTETQNKLTESLNKFKGTVGALDEAVSKTAKNTSALADASAVSGRTKLFNLEESEKRRFERMSKADKAKFGGDFERFKKDDSISSLDSLRKTRITDIGDSDFLKSRLGDGPLGQGAKAVEEVNRKTLNPKAKALGNAKQQDKREPQDKTMALLQKIEANTAAFAELLTT